MTETQRKSGWLNRSRRIVKYYYLKVMRNSGSPEYIARGAALGIFIGFAIPIGFQIAAAVPLAFLLKGAKIPAVVLTFISNYATVLVIYPLQCYIGGFLIFRPFRWAVLVEKLHGLLEERTLASLMELGTPIILSFFAGGLLFGILTAVPGYYLTLRLVAGFRRRRAERHAKEAPGKL